MAPILRTLGVLARLAAFVLALACAAAGIAGQAARWTDAPDILNHFEPVWLAGAVAAGLIGWRDRITVALAAIALGACALQMAPDILAPRDLDAPIAGAERLKIVQLNAWVNNQDPARSAAWLLAQDPDVIMMEEAYDRASPLVQALRARYPHLTNCGDGCSVLILSKAAPTAGGRLGEFGFTSWATFEGAGGTYTVVAEHATHPWPPLTQALNFQTLASELRRFPPGRLVLAGDFNSTPWSFGLRRLDRMLPLIRRTHALPTWPSARTEVHGRNVDLPIPVLPIDHVWAGRGWRTLSVERGPSVGSDHRPVVVVLQAAR